MSRRAAMSCEAARNGERGNTIFINTGA